MSPPLKLIEDHKLSVSAGNPEDDCLLVYSIQSSAGYSVVKLDLGQFANSGEESCDLRH